MEIIAGETKYLIEIFEEEGRGEVIAFYKEATDISGRKYWEEIKPHNHYLVDIFKKLETNLEVNND